MTTPALHSPSLSPEVAALAARHQLGRLQGSFAPKRLGKLLFVLYLNVLVTLSAFFLVPGALYYWWLRRFPDFSRKQAAKRLHLFEHGLIVQPQFGDGMTALRWDSARVHQDISQLFVNGVPTPTRYVYSVAAPSYGAAQITEFYESPETWGPWMQEAVLRAQAPAVMDAVLEGGTADFGALSVSRTGVTGTGKPVLPWADVQEIVVGGGSVRVIKSGAAGPWCTARVSGIANLQLFLTIAGILGRKQEMP
ncbi:DUF6585 family protein [Streptomyces geranii]|uniref:DUF6585 family protein n=1 Tax=Streptomyces geranii TaxID=2058923 RepID=UPI000D03FCD7|nr:DUF6585 family protein [Streptomyces geranii]